MSPDPDKQTTVATSYLLTEYVMIYCYDNDKTLLQETEPFFKV